VYHTLNFHVCVCVCVSICFVKLYIRILTIHLLQSVYFSRGNQILNGVCVLQSRTYSNAVAYRGGVVQPPPPEIRKALQNRTKLNPIVKTIKNAEVRTPTHQDVRKKAVKF